MPLDPPATTTTRQLLALARALAATAGEAAFRRGLPVYAGLAIASGLLFNGNGLETSTVVAGADTSPLAHTLLWSAWLLLTAPTLDAIWRTPTTFWLRSLPLPRSSHLIILLTFSLLAELPWTILWWRGGGPVSGLAATGGALTLHAVLLARPPGLVGVLLVIASLAVLVSTPMWLLSFGTWPIALVVLRRAWLAAPSRGGHHPRSAIRGPALVALALAHVIALVRGHLSVLLRSALFAGLTAAAAWLATRNNAITDLATLRVYACGFFAPAALLAGSALSTPLLAAESRIDWLLAASRTSPRTRLAAHTLAAAGLGVLLALCLAAALARAWRLAPLAAIRLLVDLALTGAALTTSSALLARWTARFGNLAAGRRLLTTLLAAVLSLVLLAALGPAAPPAWAALAASAWLLGHVLSATRPPDPGVAPVLLTMTEIRKRLGARIILDRVDLTCEPGTNNLILGPNGAGKSTLLKIAAGILEPDAGDVQISGRSLTAKEARASLGYAPDTNDALPDLSVREVLALVGALKQAPSPAEHLRDRLGLTRVWHQRMRTLSFGQVKRTWLLAALVGDPPLLILDEPSNGLDPAGADDLADLLRERAGTGHAALVSTNDAAFAGRLGGARHHLIDARLTPDA